MGFLTILHPHQQQAAVPCRSTFESVEERECFQGIVDWMNNAPNSANYTHGTVKSWFYWAYNPDSGGASSLSLALIVNDPGRHIFAGLTSLTQTEPAHLAVLVLIPDDTRILEFSCRNAVPPERFNEAHSAALLLSHPLCRGNDVIC